MGQLIHRAAADGFARGAEEYVRARPGYPTEAVGLLGRLVGSGGLGSGCTVVDLAAGTGKLTVDLVGAGADVVAVEPIEEMRAQLTALLPGVDTRGGLAESIPIEDASADLVTVAQAFHWFDASLALAEIRRVLRPGGHLAMIWNVRDETVEWVRLVGDIGQAAGGGRPYDEHTSTDWERTVAEAGGFGPVREDWFSNWQEATVELVVDRVASTSWVSALDDAARAGVLAEVRALLERHPATRGRDHFPFPHATTVVTARRLP